MDKQLDEALVELITTETLLLRGSVPLSIYALFEINLARQNSADIFRDNSMHGEANVRQKVETRRPFPWFEFISDGLGELVGPSVDNGTAIDVADASHDALLELEFGGHADVAEDGAS